ncbi:MAG TPA: nucleoside-diphosphate sugar epimerase/dehydratase [Acidimicrobiia bacterium]|jgi:FlaA1/EpsC-like NDP-sugar epimerase
MWLFALYFGALLRLDFNFSRLDGFEVALLVPLACALQWGIGAWLGLYRGRWRPGSFDEVAALARTAALVTAGLFLVDLVFSDNRPAPLTAVVMAGVIAFVLLGGIRYNGRSALDRRRRALAANRVRALVFGAGDGGERTVRAMLYEANSPFLPVALLDDDPRKRNLSICGVPVVGDRRAVATAAQRYSAAALVIAIPAADGALVRDLSELGREAGLDVRVLPSVRELFDGRVSVNDLRVPTETDLLGRRQIETDLRTVSEYLHGKRVVVVGAGGSIGSELCRQIAELGPAKLAMIDHDECGLHTVQLSLEGRALLDSPDLVLVNVRDRARLKEVMREIRPDVVFHAAALKHLPLLEANPAEALKTNVIGTLNVLEAAADVGVERFVNISTDKAAEPCNVLGYSKRITEGLTAHFAHGEPGTYLSVRFGNVLGSRGSVLVAFKHQLEAGGPITVTHPDVTRYFMTVEEAVQLVVQGGAIGEPGQVLVLDMGKPVRIADVARQLAATRTPEVPIEFTGLRPGEKLHEQLFNPFEHAAPGAHPLIHHADVPPLEPEIVRAIDANLPADEMLEVLRTLAVGLDPEGVSIDLVAEESVAGSGRRGSSVN